MSSLFQIQGSNPVETCFAFCGGQVFFVLTPFHRSDQAKVLRPASLLRFIYYLTVQRILECPKKRCINIMSYLLLLWWSLSLCTVRIKSDAALFRFFFNDEGDFEDMQKMHILKKHEGQYVFFKKVFWQQELKIDLISHLEKLTYFLERSSIDVINPALEYLLSICTWEADKQSICQRVYL